MNFDNQELMGKWCIHNDELARIAEVNINRVLSGWTPTTNVRLEYLTKLMGGHFTWVKMPRPVPIDSIDIITPEVAQIYMQANNLKLPERKPNEQRLPSSI